jgi:hypothetical protein
MTSPITERTSGVRVLFSGQFWAGANSMYLARGFERCGAVVRLLNDTAITPVWRGRIGRALLRLASRQVEAEWNSQLLAAFAKVKPDLVYITDAHLCLPQTLAQIRATGTPLMCFYHDPEFYPDSRFQQVISQFDLVVSTRKWHEERFMGMGARAAMGVRFGYDPLAHRPVTVDAKNAARYGADVTFIGTHGGPRARDLTELLEGGLKHQFKLWGNDWGKLPAESAVGRCWQKCDVFETEIPIVYGATKVALHWVKRDPSSANPDIQKGDQHNSRSFQIPACRGAVMFAQRSQEHAAFFAEDQEAVFFETVAELRDKLNYWLDPARDAARQAMSEAAYARCLREDYSYVPVVRRFLDFFGLPSN